MRKTVLLLLLSSGIYTTSFAQADSLMNMLDDGAPAKKEFVSATFKATRIINGCSSENLGAGVLDFRISHRFGDVSQGGQNFFGLDDATTRIGLDYGITKWLMIGLGHSTLDKEDDGFMKIKLLRQQKYGYLLPWIMRAKYPYKQRRRRCCLPAINGCSATSCTIPTNC